MKAFLRNPNYIQVKSRSSKILIKTLRWSERLFYSVFDGAEFLPPVLLISEAAAAK